MPTKHPAPAFRHPAVTLRMADGGEVSPWSLKGMANTIKKATTKSPQDVERDRMRAEYVARSAAAAKPAAPAPAPARETPAPMGSTAVLQRREAAAGLRNGGEVPGEGEGDKIPAMYEPGEFVVSNDMLDAEPELRNNLRSLREDVLADKGMTPEEADAKAVRYGDENLHQHPQSGRGARHADLDSGNERRPQVSLRAVDGFDLEPYVNHRAPYGPPAAPPPLSLGNSSAYQFETSPAQNNRPNFTMGGNSTAPAAKPSFTDVQPKEVGVRIGYDKEAAYGERVNPRQAPNGRFGLPENPPLNNSVPKPPVSLEPTAGGVLKDKVLGSSADWAKTGDALTKERSIPGAKALGTVAKFAAAPVSAYQTYDNIQKGNYGDAAVNAVDTAAGAALFTPAAPAAGAYLGARGVYEAPGILRNAIGEDGLDKIGGVINQIGQKTGLFGVNDDARLAYDAQTRGPTPTTQTNAPDVSPTTSPSLRTQGEAFGPNDPSTYLLGARGRDIGNTGATRFDVQGKSPLYTDKASMGSSEQMLSRPAMSENDPGMMGIQARQDNRMASLRQQAQYDQEVAAANEINARYKPREGLNRMKARLDNEASLRQDSTLRRGQDMDYQGRVLTAEQTARLARATGARDQMNKDRDFEASRGDKAFEKRQAAKKAIDDQIDNRFIDPATNKPNLQKSAEFKTFLENGLADELERLKQSKDPRAKSLAANLSYDKMDAEDIAAMHELFQNREVTMKNKGNFMPGSADFVESLRPKDWVATGKNDRTFGGDRVVYAGGSQTSVNDLTGAGLTSMYAKRNANFDRTLRNAEDAQRRQGQ